MSDLDLRNAFRAVREQYDGEHPDADATLQRALFRARALDRNRRVTRWAVLPVAAVLVASTAWAGATGRLAPTLRSIMESVGTETEPAPASLAPAVPVPSPTSESRTEMSTPVPAEVERDSRALGPIPTPAPPSLAAPGPATPSRPSLPAPLLATALASSLGPTQPAAPPRAPVSPSELEPAAASAPIADPIPPTPSASVADPYAGFFAEAHRIHFTDKDPARALAAWDRYLAAVPDGRFAPEARYNRALALVRLRRHAEAKQELTAFANGMYGEYRREEARALLTALDRDR